MSKKELYVGFQEATAGAGFVKLEPWDAPGNDWTVAPKEMDTDILSVECIYRKDVEHYWDLLQQRAAKKQIPGLVLAGPPGVGKSTMVYMLALTARRNGWLVVYIVSICCCLSSPLCSGASLPVCSLRRTAGSGRSTAKRKRWACFSTEW
jgi:Mrp family chromosome partitioning ATPase